MNYALCIIALLIVGCTPHTVVNVSSENGKAATSDTTPIIRLEKEISLNRIGVLEPEISLYDVFADDVFEYRDDWSVKASKQAAVSAAIMLKKNGYDPVVIPDPRRAREIFHLKTQLQYHGAAFHSDTSIASGGFLFEEAAPAVAYSIGSTPIEELCDGYGVDGFLYIYGYEELGKQTFVATIIAERDGRVSWYNDVLTSNDFFMQREEGEALRSTRVHVESLIAQSREMELRFGYQGLFLEDNDLNEYLSEILQKIASPDELDLYDLRVRVLKSREVNAFAAPDGAIYITTGLLARVVSETQIAAIIGHELAHIINGDASKKLSMKKENAVAKSSPLFSKSSKVKKIAPKTAPKLQTASRDKYERLLGGDIMDGRAHIDAPNGYVLGVENIADSIGLSRTAAAGYPVAQIIDGRDKKAYESDIDRAYFNIKLWNAVLYDSPLNLAAGKFERLGDQLSRLLSVDSCAVAPLVLRGDMERLLAPRSAESIKWYEKAMQCDPNSFEASSALEIARHAVFSEFPKPSKRRGYSSKLKTSALLSEIPGLRVVYKDKSTLALTRYGAFFDLVQIKKYKLPVALPYSALPINANMRIYEMVEISVKNLRATPGVFDLTVDGVAPQAIMGSNGEWFSYVVSYTLENGLRRRCVIFGSFDGRYYTEINLYALEEHYFKKAMENYVLILDRVLGNANNKSQ